MSKDHTYNENRKVSWRQFSSLTTPQVVIMTTCRVASDGKVDIVTTRGISVSDIIYINGNS